MKTIYETDFYKWTKQQVLLLKKKEFVKFDMENLIEEIGSLGRRDKAGLQSQLARLLMHQLKLKYQPEKQINSNSWLNSVLDAKRQIIYIIQNSPSLKNELKNCLNEVYIYARKDAITETKLPSNTFPKECPWGLDEIFPELNKNNSKKGEKKS